MKNILLYVLVSAFALTGSLQAGVIVPARNGKPQMTIVIPAKHNKTISIAAHTLQEYIEKICGVKLAINKDGKRVATKAFYLGACQGAPQCKLPKSGANWEGYVITEKNGDVYFNGLNPTPIAMGVYSFLEDDLGVRWFAPGELWELVPKSKTPGTLKVDVKSRTVVPQTSPRVWAGHNYGDEWTSWNRRNKVGSSEVISKRNFQNMMLNALPPEKYGKTHPEYYPLLPDGKRYIPAKGNPYWRPCESNPQVQKIVVNYIRNFFNRNPKIDSFSLGMDDITHICCCPGCLAMDDAPDSYFKQRFSDRHYKFVNLIAKEVAKTHPDRYIGTLIYQIARELPKQVPVLEPNVFGYITENVGSWWMPGAMEADQKISREWSKRVKHLSRYDYYGYGCMTPRYFPHSMDKQLKFDKSLGFKGMYIETCAFLPLTMPMHWALSKLQWDATQNVDKLLDDFMNIYGTAKPQMARFWALLEKSFMEVRSDRGWEHMSLPRQARTISVEDLDKAFAILAEAEKSAGGDAKVLARIEIHKAALQLAAYAVRPYAINLQLRDLKVDSQAAADKVFDLIAKQEAVKANRDEFIKNLRKRNDLLGKNIYGLEIKSGGYIRLKAFPELEGDSIRALFEALAWYGKNAAGELEKRAAATGSSMLQEYAAYYAKNFSNGKQPVNLLRNGNFEIRDKAIEKKQKGSPKNWWCWTGGGGRPITIEIVPDGHGGNAVKLSNCGASGCLIQIVDAQEGATYFLSCRMKNKGKARGSLEVRFRTKTGAFCKNMDSEMSIALPQGEHKEWQPVTMLVYVPKGIGAQKISVQPNFKGLKGESYLMLDDFKLFRIK